MGAALAVLQRMVSGLPERSRPEPAPQGDDGGKPCSAARAVVRAGRGGRARGRGGGVADSHLPRVEVIWDFEDSYCCPECGEPFTGLGSDHVTELLDWRVVITLVAHCPRRYKKACKCPGPVTVTAPGPPKAIGKGSFSDGFIAMLLTERFVAGRSMNSLVTGLARHGAEISPATLAGDVRAGRGAAGPAGLFRSRSGTGIPGTCTPMRRRGGCSCPGTGTARRSGGCGCRLARTPFAL